MIEELCTRHSIAASLKYPDVPLLLELSQVRRALRGESLERWVIRKLQSDLQGSHRWGEAMRGNLTTSSFTLVTRPSRLCHQRPYQNPDRKNSEYMLTQ